MPLIVSNNNLVTLGVGLLSTDLTMTVSSIVGMPDVSGAGDYTTLSLINVSTGSIEYVKCTDLDTLNRIYTIERGVEDSLALDFPLASEVRNFFTAGMFNDLASSASSAMQTASHTIDGTLSVANPAGTNSDLLILAKYGNQLIEGTDYTISGGGETVSFIGSQAVETEVVTFIYSTPVVTNGVKSLNDRIIVTQASDFGTIDPTKEYFIDGIVDMGAVSIEVPSGGINLRGYNLGISKLISSAGAYVMFTSPVGGSGSVLSNDMAFTVTGTGSSIFALTDATGFNAVEHSRVNWDDCTSLGYLDGYRQGFESGTGRFGGQPQLELRGTWLGGYRMSACIVRSLVDGSYFLFKAGAGFVMNSRFLTDLNADLNTTVGICDFTSANFASPSELQFHDCEIKRNGVKDATDTTLIPNMTSSTLESDWRSNKGLNNTHTGGETEISVEALTTINTINVPELFAGTWTTSDLQHFDQPSAGQLRHLGDDPREYRVHLSFSVAGSSGENLCIRMRMWDNSASVFVDLFDQVKPINNLQGGRDFAYFDLVKPVALDQNDYMELQIINKTSANDVTAELGSYMLIEER